MTGLQQVRVLARRIDAATPPQRDRAVDALRALAIAGVIGGHWLVTALVLGKSGRQRCAERQQPAGLDAVAGPAVLGVPDARGLLPGRRLLGGPRLPGRLPRLAAQADGPAGPSGRGPGRGLDSGHGGHVPGRRPAATVRTILFLVISPLWFLGVYAVLTALTPAAMWLVRRFGAWAAAFPVAVVAVADLVRFGLHGVGSTGPPGWAGPTFRPAGWSRT